MNNVEKVKKELINHASLERKKKVEVYFKTGKGDYGEGDEFIGVTNPDVRKIAKVYKDISLSELEQLICSKIHEERLCALIILVNKNKKADVPERVKILDFYLKNIAFVNNWDLVDCSAHYILGHAILDGIQSKNILDKFADSNNIWKRRVAIIATMHFIDNKLIEDTLRLSEKMLSDKEVLIHKAVGWMLREAWKKDAIQVEDFLKTNYSNIPRTTLRYAIEKMTEEKRKKVLLGKFD